MDFKIEKFDEIDVNQSLKESGLLLAAANRAIIRVDGRINARGGDNKILVRCNNAFSGYKSFVIMDGNHHSGEWEQRGLYVGRNGWGVDTDFSFSLTVSIQSARKRIAYGMSTFGHADERILGYTCNGFWSNTTDQIDYFTFWLIGSGTGAIVSRKIIFES